MLIFTATNILSVPLKFVLRLHALVFVRQEVIFDGCDYSILGYFSVSLAGKDNKAADIILKSRK